MALGTLSFKARAHNVDPEDRPSAVCLRGEVEWMVSGPADEINSLAEAVGSRDADRVSTNGLLLHFGNAVGRFFVGNLGTLIVRCDKWDEGTFDALLADLTAVALALPFAADQLAGLPHDRTLDANNAILMHAFVYARRILLDRESGLAISMAPIFADPHRRFTIERRRVPLNDARRVDARSFARLVAGAEEMERAVGVAGKHHLAKSLRGYMPTHIDCPRVLHSVDTAENRFVFGFLNQLDDVVERVNTLARRRSGSHGFWSRVGLECDEMRRALRPLRGHSIWQTVGRLSHVPAASSVLQRRRGYREVLRHYLLLRAATRLPNDASLSDLLGMKDVAALYELWCFFMVVRALETVLGRRPDAAGRHKVDEIQIGVPRGLRVAWGDEVEVFYNLEFRRNRHDSHRSSSLKLRPDIVINVQRGNDQVMHVLDAKLRIERSDSQNESDEEKSFKWADIGKMHTYRDALPAVRTAFVLYPGDEVESFRIEGAESGSVGAIPLVPGKKHDSLVAHLRLVLGLTLPNDS